MANKLSVALRELVESRMWLYIISGRKYVKQELLKSLLSETESLEKTLYASIAFAREKMKREIKKRKTKRKRGISKQCGIEENSDICG